MRTARRPRAGHPAGTIRRSMPRLQLSLFRRQFKMLCGIITLGLLALVYFIKQAGRAEAEKEQTQQVLHDINEANNVRVDLDNDPAADERVRDRFTR